MIFVLLQFFNECFQDLCGQLSVLSQNSPRATALMHLMMFLSSRTDRKKPPRTALDHRHNVILVVAFADDDDLRSFQYIQIVDGLLQIHGRRIP